MVASGVDQLLETVVTGPAIKTVADLKNKKIGVSRFGSLTDMALREALRLHKLNPDKDVTILQTGGEATRFAALTSGAIDGAMLSGDKKVQAEKMGFRVAIDLSQLPIYYAVNGIVACRSSIESYWRDRRLLCSVCPCIRGAVRKGPSGPCYLIRTVEQADRYGSEGL